MDLSFTEEQELLRDTVRDLCAQHASPDAVRASEDGPVGFSRALWEELAKLDLLGLTIAEEYGGSEQSMLETVIVCEELGRALAPSPYLVTAVLAKRLLEVGGTPGQRSTWLPRIAAGQAVLTPAWLEPGRGEGSDGIELEASPSGDGFLLRGVKVLVPFAEAADALLVLARDGEQGLTVFLVPTDRAGLRLEWTPTLAGDASFTVSFDDVVLEPDCRLGTAGQGWRLWTQAMDDLLIGVAAYAVAGAERAHEMAVDYAKERVQFGRPIGSFQAIAHPLADTAMEISGARTLVYEAAWARDTGRAAGPLTAMAKLYACDVFRRTTKIGQQIYGGIGFTRVIDMQLYFRRAKQLELSWWGPRSLEERIAAAELDAPSAFVTVDAGG